MDKYKRGKTIAIIPVAAAASVASVMTVSCDGSVKAGQQKPNIIVFLVDDMGLMDTSVPFLTDPEGQPVEHPLNRWYRTPNMQRLADQGRPAPACSPARMPPVTESPTGYTPSPTTATPTVRPTGTGLA